jgi:hypothetical protein
MSDVVVGANGLASIIVTNQSGVSAFVTPATPANFYVAGALIGPQGITGATGPTGATGATGGIVPITVSATAPLGPSLNDLWIDIS